jgi:tetratricopeptide (TPR) repeat protein
MFICNSPSCAISISKAEFPESMLCPICQESLCLKSENTALKIDVDSLLANLPYVIAYPLQKTLSEKHSGTKINLLKDTFLNYLKYIGLLAASEFFTSPYKDKRMVSLFYDTLAEPSFGSWNHFIRETLNFLKKQHHKFFCPELALHYEFVETGKKRKLYKGEIEIVDSNGSVQLIKQEATAIGMLINFRNRYLGHGLTLDESTALQLWDMYFPIFLSLLEKLEFAAKYPMYKNEYGLTFRLQSTEISESSEFIYASSQVWLQNRDGQQMDILPFFVVPGEVSISREEKEKILTFESYTGKTIKFFSPEGTTKQTSGKILERLNLLLIEKQKEIPFTPETFTRENFLDRIVLENKLTLDSLYAEKKVIPNVYVHREDIEIKLREWIGSSMSIFFIAAEAGSGKTNILAEMQKQYTNLGLPTLLIRLSRMEKDTLVEQIAHLLNIDNQKPLSEYTSIVGTQEKPTIILLDGLNEHYESNRIWNEILNLSNLFAPGELKFVVTNRCNTNGDISRYEINEQQSSILYSDKKDRNKTLESHVFWLSPLNMKEMSEAWNQYSIKDKNKYKPLFTFEDIATFDRGIYNQINTPLVLRLFLETYSNQHLPNKDNRRLNVWEDWLKTFSPDEIEFMELLANEVWKIGQNEIHLDDLLKIPKLRNHLINDNINAPYIRLKNLGWVTRYVRDSIISIGFTVEGALIYLIGIELYKTLPKLDEDSILSILKENNTLKKSAIESFLCNQAINGDLDLILTLVDSYHGISEVCINPLLLFAKSFGAKKLVFQLLQNPTENDWDILLKINDTLEQLILFEIQKELLNTLTPFNKLSYKSEITLGLRAFQFLDESTSLYFLSEFEKPASIIFQSSDLMSELLNIYYDKKDYDKCLEITEKILLITEFNDTKQAEVIADTYDTVGHIWREKNDFNKAIMYHNKSLSINLGNFNKRESEIILNYYNIGTAYNCMREKENEKDLALTFLIKSSELQMKKLGTLHPDLIYPFIAIAQIHFYKGRFDEAHELFQKSIDIITRINPKFNNSKSYLQAFGIAYFYIASIWEKKAEIKKAIEYFQLSLTFEEQRLGEKHSKIIDLYKRIAVLQKKNGDFESSIVTLNKCLEITKRTHGSENPELIQIYFDIGLSQKSLLRYDMAIDAFMSGRKIQKKGGIAFQIAVCFENKHCFNEAFIYFMESAEIRKNDKFALNNSKLESVNNCKRLAIKLGKEDELPEWMNEI